MAAPGRHLGGSFRAGNDAHQPPRTMVRIFLLNELNRAAMFPVHPLLPPFKPDLVLAHQADAYAIAIMDGMAVARASVWWTNVPRVAGEQLGVIGHFAALESSGAEELLNDLCRELSRHGCSRAIGPMDGNTWRRYRLLTERGTEPPFFMEPD